MNNCTRELEQQIQKEQKPRINHLIRLFCFVFHSAKGISCIYLSLFVLLSLMRPIIALIWSRYIALVEVLKPQNTIFETIVFLCLYAVISFVSDLLESYLAAEGGGDFEQLDMVQENRLQEQFKSRLLEKINSISPEYLEASVINDRIKQVLEFATDGWNGINRRVMISGYVVIAKIVSVLSIAATLYIYHPLLSIIVLLAPMPTLYSVLLGEKMQIRFVKDNTELQRQMDYFESLMLSPAAKEIKTLGLYDFFFQKWKNKVDSYVLNQRKVIRNQALLQLLNSFVTHIAHVGSMVLAIILLIYGKLTIGALSAVFSIIGTLVTDSAQLIRAAASFIAQKDRAAQFFDLIDIPEDIAEKKKGLEFTSFHIENLSYRYPLTDRFILKDIDFNLKKGEKIAFVGENGMGKSTFVKILTGLLSPSSGNLYLNGINTNQMNSETRFDAQSVVVQDPTHYETFTLRDNVFLGEPKKPRDEDSIEKSLMFSGIDDLDDTMLGKFIGGTDLSGGQWQKLAIARAAYRNRDLIILDEPTSNLDPLAETEIFQKYIALSHDKTVIYVTHRISVAKLADRIVVFKDGQIIEDGSHEQLMASNGEYARLYQTQAQWYDR